MVYQPPFTLPVGINPNLESIKKALVIVAHPDDIDYGCAGTVAMLTSKGIEVSYCLVTSGDAGGDNDGLSVEQRMEMREAEQTSAANTVGVQDLFYLRESDGRVIADLDLREKLTRIIRIVLPDLVITQSPIRRYDRIFASHPDHLAVGEASICAAYPDAQNPNAHNHLIGEGIHVHTIKALWIMADENPDTIIDITDFLEDKFAALFCHESQIQDQDAVRNMVEKWTNEQAVAGGLGDNKYGEAFKFVQIMY